MHDILILFILCLHLNLPDSNLPQRIHVNYFKLIKTNEYNCIKLVVIEFFLYIHYENDE
jgi:hypothetical protein